MSEHVVELLAAFSVSLCQHTEQPHQLDLRGRGRGRERDSVTTNDCRGGCHTHLKEGVTHARHVVFWGVVGLDEALHNADKIGHKLCRGGKGSGPHTSLTCTPPTMCHILHTFLRCGMESGLALHISSMRVAAPTSTPWFFSRRRERVSGTNISMSSGTLRIILKGEGTEEGVGEGMGEGTKRTKEGMRVDGEIIASASSARPSSLLT